MAPIRRRDLIAVVGALSAITALAWLYLLYLAGQMNTAPVGSGMSGMSMEMTGLRPWTAIDFTLTFLMWSIMMVGMMVPSAMPMTLLYARVARSATDQGRVVAPTLVFVAGYVGMWALFSLLATGAQWGLERLALLSPMMVSTSPLLGAGLLVAAGVYQMTPAKYACLSHCRSPIHLLAHGWRNGALGALRMGASHGLSCLGCCWAIMLLLFVGGVMNLVWVAAIAFFVLLEKVLPLGRVPSWVAGAAMIIAGVVLLVRGMS